MQLNRCITVMLLASIGLTGCNLFRTATETASDPNQDMEVVEPDVGPANDAGNNLEEMGNNTADMGLNVPDLPREEFETEEPVVAPRTRATDGLIALWLFDEGAGEVLNDVSGFDPPLNLSLSGDTAWSSSSGSLTFQDGRAIAMSPTKIYDRWLESERMSVEFWARSTDQDQSGPTRILTLSTNSAVRNFTVGFEVTEFHVRIKGNRTPPEATLINGAPYFRPGEIVDLAVHHWVMTFDGWKVRLYKDGELVATETRPTGFETWDRTLPLLIGNEFDGERNFRGELFLMALYDRVLLPEEVALNFEAGISVNEEEASIPPELR